MDKTLNYISLLIPLKNTKTKTILKKDIAKVCRVQLYHGNQNQKAVVKQEIYCRADKPLFNKLEDSEELLIFSVFWRYNISCTIAKTQRDESLSLQVS